MQTHCESAFETFEGALRWRWFAHHIRNKSNAKIAIQLRSLVVEIIDFPVLHALKLLSTGCPLILTVIVRAGASLRSTLDTCTAQHTSQQQPRVTKKGRKKKRKEKRGEQVGCWPRGVQLRTTRCLRSSFFVCCKHETAERAALQSQARRNTLADAAGWRWRWEEERRTRARRSTARDGFSCSAGRERERERRG